MVVTKNQIRPRRKKFHFTNAEILLLDTVGFIQMVTGPALGQVLAVSEVQIRTNIVVDYGNIDATNPFLEMVDDFGNGVYFEDIATSAITNFTQLFTQAFPGKIINLANAPFPLMAIDDSGTFNNIDPQDVYGWTNYADLLANGGIQFYFSNGGADLNGGDPANYMDIFLDYLIVDL